MPHNGGVKERRDGLDGSRQQQQAVGAFHLLLTTCPGHDLIHH